MEEKKKHLFGKGIAVGAALSFLLFGFMIIIFCLSISFLMGKFGLGKSDAKLALLKTLINQYYYEDVDEKTLTDGIYSGLVNSLGDKYSEYYNEKDYEQVLIDVTGDYAGVGALLQKNIETGQVTIIKVYKNTPAEIAGLMAGDEIIYADEHAADENDLDVFVQYIRGPVNTDVVIKFLRNGEEKETVCTRAKVTVPSVEYQMLEGNIGYIEMTQFANSTAKDFIAAYEDLKTQGMKGIIVDLRSNGGGLVDVTADILDYLLPEGVTVYVVDKYGNREDYKSDKACQNIPMVVLTSANTASASEIFSGAVRDYYYATIVGTKTFGKGIVQSTIPLGDGTAIKLTTSRYYTPAGECIHGVGIEPDIELEYKYEGNPEEPFDIRYDNQVNKAKELLLK